MVNLSSLPQTSTEDWAIERITSVSISRSAPEVGFGSGSSVDGRAAATAVALGTTDPTAFMDPKLLMSGVAASVLVCEGRPCIDMIQKVGNVVDAVCCRPVGMRIILEKCWVVAARATVIRPSPFFSTFIQPCHEVKVMLSLPGDVVNEFAN